MFRVHPLRYYQRLISLCLACAVIAATPISVSAHQGASGIVKERMDQFSQARGQMKKINGALRASDLLGVAEITSQMMAWADEMADAFPDGSDYAPSQASPAIWQDKTGFAAAIARYDGAIDDLYKAARANDSNAALEGFQALGASCKSCHRAYRK